MDNPAMTAFTDFASPEPEPEDGQDAAAQAAETDRSGQYPWPMVRRMAEAGFMGLTIPQEWGGPGGSGGGKVGQLIHGGERRHSIATGRLTHTP